MISPPEVDYTVVLVFPGYGSERENAETIVESALDWLNTHKEKPGFRFAGPVSAHLEIVADIDEVRERIESDDSLAMVLLHDVDDDERDDLLRDCQARHVSACYTVDAPRHTGPRQGPWKVVVRQRTPEDVPAHRLAGGTLTDPVVEDEDTGGRVSEVIAVLALGVMEHHWRKTLP
jgi:hypothetical protein